MCDYDELSPYENFKDLYCTVNVYKFLDEYESKLQKNVDTQTAKTPNQVLEEFCTTLKQFNLSKY